MLSAYNIKWVPGHMFLFTCTNMVIKGGKSAFIPEHSEYLCIEESKQTSKHYFAVC